MNQEDMWADIIHRANTYAEHATGPDDAIHWQITKLTEELGEVSEAFIGITGQNPRKGVTHTIDDVRAELCDVIITAMVALATAAIEPSPGMLIRTLEDHHAKIVNRAQTVGAETTGLVPGFDYGVLVYELVRPDNVGILGDDYDTRGHVWVRFLDGQDMIMKRDAFGLVVGARVYADLLGGPHSATVHSIENTNVWRLHIDGDESRLISCPRHSIRIR